MDENLELCDKLERLQIAFDEKFCEIENLRETNITLKNSFEVIIFFK